MELRTNEADAQAKAWPVWVARHGRLAQGAHDTGGRKTRWQTLSFFGTSFTAQPRFTQSDIGSLARKVFDARLDDFIRALEAPGRTIGGLSIMRRFA